MTERDTQGGDPEVGVCHVCGREFPTQEELSQHLMDDHEDAGLELGARDPSAAMDEGGS